MLRNYSDKLWSMLPRSLDSMLKEQALYTEKNASKPEAFFMLDDFQAARPMQVIDGVAVITIEGVMAREVDFFTQLFGGGGTSTREIIEQINTAVNSPAVNSVLLVWDSPGGTVDGTEQLGDAIAAAARTKRTVTPLNICSNAFIIIGPRQIVGVSSLTRKPIDMHLIP